MKRYFFLLLLPLIAVILNSCNDEDEVLNQDLIEGQWEVISSDHPDYTCIYDFTTDGRGFAEGELYTYYIISNNNGEETKKTIENYYWHATGPQNNNNRLEVKIIPLSVINSPEAGDKLEEYLVTELSSRTMTWKRISPNDGLIRRFVRKSNL